MRLQVIFFLLFIPILSVYGQEIPPKHIVLEGEPLWPEDAVTFKLEKIFGTDEDDPERMLGQVEDIKIDANGNVYVLDFGFNQLIKFNKHGRLKWRAGQPGQGPGDFNYAISIALDDDSNIYSLNQLGARLDVWNEDGDYLNEKSALLKEPAGVFSEIITVLDDGRIVISNNNNDNADYWVQLLNFNDTEYIVESEFIIPRKVNSRYGRMMGQSLSLADGLINAPVYFDSLIVDRYSLDGAWRDRLQVGREVKAHVGIGTNNRGEFTRATMFGAKYPPVQLRDGVFLLRQQGVEGYNLQDALNGLASKSFSASEASDFPNSDYQMIIFNESGQILWRNYTTDETEFLAWRILAVDDNGAVYFYIEDPFPQIQRGRLIMPELGSN